MKLAMVLSVLLFAAVAQAQTVVTANPTSIDFGTLYPGEFDTETITYTCATGPCVGAAPKITGGHAVLVSANTCKANWTFFVPGQTGDTCSVSWTLTATSAEVNCPGNVCTGTVGISVTNGVSSDAVVVSGGYTATVLSPKPTLAITPTELGWFWDPFQDGPVEQFTTVTNVSEVSVSVSVAISGSNADYFILDPAFTVNLGPGQETQIGVTAAQYKVPHGCELLRGRECSATEDATLKIWSTSTTPGTPGTPFLEGRVKLSDAIEWNICDEGKSC